MSNNRNHSYIYNVSMKDHTFWQHWRQEHILQLPQNYGKSCFHKPLPVCEHSGWYYIIAKVKKKIIIYIAMIQIWFRTHITCTLYYWLKESWRCDLWPVLIRIWPSPTVWYPQHHSDGLLASVHPLCGGKHLKTILCGVTNGDLLNRRKKSLFWKVYE